jgi:catechol 2,3-dioxygenase-like lactoylglutathione lyase family enzyme
MEKQAKIEPISGLDSQSVAPTLHHAQVFYPPGEEATARQFYTEGLGLREIARPETLRDRSGIWFEAGMGHVHLSADSELGLHPRRHFALRVEDLDQITQRLRGAGARFEKADPIPGWKRIYVFDPFGNKIELDEIP